MSLLRTIVRGFRGDRHDHTTGDLRESIILLAVPMVMEMMWESLFAIVDSFWVGHLGPEAQATVGVTELMMTIVYTLAIGASMGAAATVARRIGEKNPDGAARAAVQAIGLGLVIAGVLAVLGVTFAPQLLGILGASESVIRTGTGFTQVMLGGNASVFLLFLINAVFRGAGDAAIAMRTLIFANILNILLGPCFIFGLGPFPEMGVTGAAVATTIGRSCGVLFQLWQLSRASGHLVVRRRHIRFDPEVMKSLIRIGATGAFQMGIAMTSWIGLGMIVISFGTQVMAGYFVGVRVLMFALLPMWGLCNAAATLVGQNLGAGRPERAEEAVWTAARFSMIVLTGVGVIFLLSAHLIVRAFSTDPEVVRIGTQFLRIVALGCPFYAYAMALTAAFNGAGDTWTPTLISLFCFWLWEIPLAWILARVVGIGPAGVFTALTVAYSTMAVVAVVLFKRGRWKQKKV
jgi:putative MATE family efflux protein